MSFHYILNFPRTAHEILSNTNPNVISHRSLTIYTDHFIDSADEVKEEEIDAVLYSLIWEREISIKKLDKVLTNENKEQDCSLLLSAYKIEGIIENEKVLVKTLTLTDDVKFIFIGNEDGGSTILESSKEMGKSTASNIFKTLFKKPPYIFVFDE